MLKLVVLWQVIVCECSFLQLSRSLLWNRAYEVFLQNTEFLCKGKLMMWYWRVLQMDCFFVETELLIWAETKIINTIYYILLSRILLNISCSLAISYRVLNWWHHKNDSSEIMGFIHLFRTTYLKKVHTQNIGSLVH